MIDGLGFFKTPRAFLYWEWYTNVNTCKLFFHCLLKANYSTKKWQGITIEKGEFITSTEKLAIETGLTISKVRTAIKKLESTDDLKIEVNSKYSKVIVTSELFHMQDFKKQSKTINDKQDSKQNDELMTIQSQSNDNQMTTTKKEQEELIINKKKRFKENVFAHSNFSNIILNAFFNYWSELDISQGIMRFENQRFFEIEKRLEKWVKQEKNNGNKGQNNKTSINR